MALVTLSTVSANKEKKCLVKSGKDKEQHTLTIYTILDDGKKYYFNFDVTDQMTEESITPGHLEIDIPDLPIPEPIKEGGFHPELSDWEEVVIDIDM